MEVLIVLVVVAVIAGGVLTSFLAGRTSFVSADASALIQQQARQAFDNMVRELRESATISCGEAGTTTSCTSSRLNFQIVRSYSAGAVELGSDVAAGEFVHYIITGTGNNAQLVRCRSTAATTATATFGTFSGCRVVANYVNGSASVSRFSWESATRIVTPSLEIAYYHPVLPTGRHTTGVLTSRVRLRSPAS